VHASACVQLSPDECC